MKMNIKCNKCGESVEVAMKIMWDALGDYLVGHVGGCCVCVISKVENNYRLKMSFRMKRDSYKTLDEAKAEAQRLFDEWMGGLIENNQ
jgi:hypothetical protein